MGATAKRASFADSTVQCNSAFVYGRSARRVGGGIASHRIASHLPARVGREVAASVGLTLAPFQVPPPLRLHSQLRYRHVVCVCAARSEAEAARSRSGCWRVRLLRWRRDLAGVKGACWQRMAPSNMGERRRCRRSRHNVSVPLDYEIGITRYRIACPYLHRWCHVERTNTSAKRRDARTPRSSALPSGDHGLLARD
jgi:hypothetical protein